MENKYSNFRKSLLSLKEAISDPIVKPRDVAGIIQNFEFVYELAWKVLQAHLADQGFQVGTPREAIKKAYQAGIINNEKVWLDIISDRNLSVHTYNENLASQMVDRIVHVYFNEMESLKNKLESYFD